MTYIHKVRQTENWHLLTVFCNSYFAMNRTFDFMNTYHENIHMLLQRFRVFFSLSTEKFILAETERFCVRSGLFIRRETIRSRVSKNPFVNDRESCDVKCRRKCRLKRRCQILMTSSTLFRWCHQTEATILVWGVPIMKLKWIPKAKMTS